MDKIKEELGLLKPVIYVKKNKKGRKTLAVIHKSEIYNIQGCKAKGEDGFEINACFYF